MSHLERRVSIACPLAQAAMRLRHFFAETGSPDGDVAKLLLQIDVRVPGLPAPLTLQRAVVATVRAHHLPADMTPRFRVEWAPETPGPFPLFAGELFVDGDDYESFDLSLSGDYTPPLGLIGKGFDVAVGNRIAEATAADLLDRIKAFAERAYALDEETKRRALEART